jgi:hypothetical protein
MPNVSVPKMPNMSVPKIPNMSAADAAVGGLTSLVASDPEYLNRITGAIKNQSHRIWSGIFVCDGTQYSMVFKKLTGKVGGPLTGKGRDFNGDFKIVGQICEDY